jgi:hypothetical protein
LPSLANNAIYDIPRVDSNIEAVEYALQADTWSTPVSSKRIKKNITIEDTFSMHAQLCTPNAPQAPPKSSLLQIATHGLVFDKRLSVPLPTLTLQLTQIYRYWDPMINPSEYSYVHSALSSGYSIFTYSRLGTGLSSKPSAYTTVQAPLELEILRTITIMARSGSLQSLIPQRASTPPPLQPSKPFAKPLSQKSFMSAIASAPFSLTPSSLPTVTFPMPQS